jgi:hypothetical protein
MPLIDREAPLRPLIETLIARGVIEDPDPLTRPFMRDAIAEAIRRARPRHRVDSMALAQLRAALPEEHDTAGAWQMTGAVGVQGWRGAQRHAMHPDTSGGHGGWGQIDASLEGRGVWATTTVETNARLRDDPDWPGRARAAGKAIPFRVSTAALHGQYGGLQATLGTVARHWGLPEATGLALSEGAYPRAAMALRLGGARIWWEGVHTTLPSVVDSAQGMIDRTFLAHRLRWRPHPRWDLALWETAILAEPVASTAGSMERLVSVMAFAAQFGRPNDNNTILGGDIVWRPTPTLTLGGQFAADDIRLGGENVDAGERPRPDRYAMSVFARGAGPLGGAWRIAYERISAQAYRTLRPTESYVADGTGLVVIMPDRDLATLSLTVPVRGGVVRPTVQVGRQGAGRLTDPVDFSETSPIFLRDPVQRTVRLGGNGVQQIGALTLEGDVGVVRTTGSSWQGRGWVRARIALGGRGPW